MLEKYIIMRNELVTIFQGYDFGLKSKAWHPHGQGHKFYITLHYNKIVVSQIQKNDLWRNTSFKMRN